MGEVSKYFIPKLNVIYTKNNLICLWWYIDYEFRAQPLKSANIYLLLEVWPWLSLLSFLNVMFSLAKWEWWYFMGLLWDLDKLCERQNAQDNWGHDCIWAIIIWQTFIKEESCQEKEGACGFTEADKQDILWESCRKMEVSITLEYVKRIKIYVSIILNVDKSQKTWLFLLNPKY